MRALRIRFLLLSAARLIAIAILFAATACATTTPTSSSRFGTLEGVIKDERLVSGPEIQLVRIERGGRTTETRVGMALTKADRIVTAPGVKAVITFAEGWEVILEPGSDLEILNPSIFVHIGEAIVTTLRKVREVLKAQTKYTSGAAEGTLFKIEVRGEEVTYKVVDGQLRVSSRLEAWTPVVLGPFDQVTVVGTDKEPKLDRLSPPEAEEIRREALQVSLLLPPPPDLEPPPEPVYDSKYYCTRAIVTFELGSLEEAASLAHKALDLHKEDGLLSRSDHRRCSKIAEGPPPPPDPYDSKYYCTRAIQTSERGNLEEAASLARQALDLHKEDGRLSESEYETCRKLADGPPPPPTVQELLGYPASTRLLIVHGDDLGMAHSVNRATFEALQERWITSASILVPCPWFPEVVRFARQHPEVDLGIHLAVNSEWTDYRWRPVSPVDAVPSLLDEQGYLPLVEETVVARARPGEVERELGAQVDRARAAGLRITHLDSHMATLFRSPALFEAYQRVGAAYGLPLLLERNGNRNSPVAPIRDEALIDRVVSIGPGVPPEKWLAAYKEMLAPLPPGVYQLIVHLAFDDEEMRGATWDHPDWGAAWRQADLDLVRSQAFQEFLRAEGFVLINWRDLARARR